MGNESINLAVSGDEGALLVQAARMYYEQQLNQSQIADELKISRSTVSRLLQRARDEGIVQITIRYPNARHIEFEDQLVQMFGLKGIRVLRGGGTSAQEVLQGLGALAAKFLDEVVRDGMTVGVSYGKSVASTIHQLKPTRQVNMNVVQIIGALGTGNPLTEATDLVRQLANAYEAKYRYLHAPLIMEDRRARELLMQEPPVQEALAIGRRADVVVIGIGAMVSSVAGTIWAGYLTEKDEDYIRNIGGIGHMCAQFFDVQGKELDIDINKRTISIGLQALRDIEHVIAIAGTKEKAPAILGALRGGYVDTLVTDEQAAQEIIRLAQAEETPAGATPSPTDH